MLCKLVVEVAVHAAFKAAIPKRVVAVRHFAELMSSYFVELRTLCEVDCNELHVEPALNVLIRSYFVASRPARWK